MKDAARHTASLDLTLLVTGAAVGCGENCDTLPSREAGPAPRSLRFPWSLNFLILCVGSKMWVWEHSFAEQRYLV